MTTYPTLLSPQEKDLIQKEFSHISSTFFNTAYFGPSPYRAKQKLQNALFKELDPSFFQYHSWTNIADRMRKKLSLLIGLPEDNISLGSSSGDTVSHLAHFFPLKKEDRVCALQGDYPSLILPWMVAKEKREFDFTLLPGVHQAIDGDWLAKNLPTPTRIFCISYVQFDSGRKINLKSVIEYCKKENIFLVVDVTQGLGGLSLPPEAKEIDMMVCSVYKWMLGPYGESFAYYSPKALQILPRATGNWLASKNSRDVRNLIDYTTEMLPGARKFDRGQAPNMLTNACLDASIEVLSELTLAKIEVYNQNLKNYFLDHYPKNKFELITPNDRNFQGNILSLRGIHTDPVTLEDELKHNNIDVSVREGKLRLSFHLFNTVEQVNQLIRSLDI
ncbi:MAG: aminotransferase class V-fold PLP-dependent enzyme [Bacteriovoracaceae bacterium]|nr:aminotransferase class V-fold PLP-dependent enzyme [Bacteriovoracaceae bacterium]